MQYRVFDPASPTRGENHVAMTTPAGPSNGMFSSSLSSQARSSEPLVLTTAERNIASLVAEGARNHDIARQLGVSHRTVESHLSNIFAKLGIGSRVQLALWISGSSKADM
jgi:DNA-binding NarL/FixJ family response regulator